jgi:transcriptional regulator with XRE-family HTH domain
MKTLRNVVEEEMRKDKKLTHKMVSERLGITIQAYNQQLQRDTTKHSTREKFAKALNINVDIFNDNVNSKLDFWEQKSLEWNQKEDGYRRTIENLLSTISNLSLGKFKPYTLANQYFFCAK